MHRRHNGLRTAVLLGGLSALIIVIGSFFGRTGLIVALVIALGTNAYAYWNSDKLALRAMRARPVSEFEAPQLYRIVRELSTAGPPAHAAAVHLPDRGAQRLRHRPQPAQRGRLLHRRHPAASWTSASCAASSATSSAMSTTATS